MTTSPPMGSASTRSTDGRDEPAPDRGVILVLVLVLCVVLSVIVIALANYAATGLRTSDASTDRTDHTAAATAAAFYSIEQLARTDAIECEADAAVPVAITPADLPAASSCRKVSTVESPAIYEVSVRTLDGQSSGRLTATVAVRDDMAAPRSVRVVDWSGD